VRRGVKLLAEFLELAARPFSAARRTKVAHELVGVDRDLLEHGSLAGRFDLRVAQERSQLGHVLHRLGSAGEVGGHRVHRPAS
jgi:hypothetical protein